MPKQPTLPSRARLFAAALVLSLLAACGGGGDDPEATPKVAVAQSAEAVATAQPAGATKVARPARSPRAHSVLLAAPADAMAVVRAGAVSAGQTSMAVPQRIGFGRAVAETASTANTRAALEWQTMEGGRRAAALSLRSSEAAGLRLGLLVRALPASATLRIYAQDGSTAYAVPAATVLDALQANHAAGDASDAGSTWWAPTIPGEEATLEIELPPGVDAAGVDVAIPSLGHLVVLASDELAVTKLGESASCELDVTCTTGYETESKAVLRINFSDGFYIYTCSATLMADRVGSRTPYALTANHCINTQTSASSIEADWLYRAVSCRATTVDPRSTTIAGGAALLYASASTDTSFILLASQPPAGASFAGWSSDPAALNSSVFSLHHPGGDGQKVSVGTVSSYNTCQQISDSIYCNASTANTSTFLNVRLSLGSTASGSSGGALFADDGHYVIGQLFGGSASCRNRSGSNFYGRFDRAYSAALYKWLDNSPLKPIYRFYNSATGAHFYTINVVERDYVIANYRTYQYEGMAFKAYPTAQNGTSPVFRFYNTRTQAHFFTIDRIERDYVIANYPQFSYEGDAWYAQTANVAGTTALYRFFNRANSTHFFTTNVAERDSIIRTPQSTYSYEGVGYYVWPLP